MKVNVREYTKRAQEALKSKMRAEGWDNHNQVAGWLGINSSFIYLLMEGNRLRPTLYDKLVELRMIPPPPPTVEVSVAAVATLIAAKKIEPSRNGCDPKKKRKRRPRLSINKENPESAVRSIIKHIDPEVALEIATLVIEELSAEGLGR